MNRRAAIKKSILGAGAIAFHTYYREIKDTALPDLPAYDKASDKYWRLVKEQFKFTEGLTYFNNASLGATPLSVIDKTHAFRNLLHQYPSKYMWGGWKDEKEQVRDKVATLIGADPDEVALTHNTTEGMNVIASSLQLEEGDEVILGNHEHFTARIPWKYYQERKGIKLVKVELPLVPESKQELIDVYENAITDKTRVISVVHMTNTNGMILPIKEITKIAHKKEILVAVDGAQSLASFPINLHDIGCDYYAASAHKWLFSPKGMGVLYCRKETEQQLQPLIANHKWNDKTMRRVEDYNTRNLPELLGLGVAVDFHNAIGAEAIMERMQVLRNYFLEEVDKIPTLTLHTPRNPKLSQQIIAVERSGEMFYKFKKRLERDHQIGVRSMGSHDIGGIRISLAIFNLEEDIERLVEAMTNVE